MNKVKILLVFFLALPCLALAQTLKSATWSGPAIPCRTYAYAPDLMPLSSDGRWETQNAAPGAGIYPAGHNLLVRKVCVTHGGHFAGPAYAVVGHSGPNGDHVTPWTEKTDGEPACMTYESDIPVVVTGGEYFDVHAGCSSGSHHVVLQLWFLQP